MTEFEFKIAALDFIGRNGMSKQTTCSFSFGKIVTLIYTDCDYLNSKLYFVVIFYFFLQFKYLSNKLEQFYASSSSEKIFF